MEYIYGVKHKQIYKSRLQIAPGHHGHLRGKLVIAEHRLDEKGGLWPQMDPKYIITVFRVELPAQTRIPRPVKRAKPDSSDNLLQCKGSA